MLNMTKSWNFHTYTMIASFKKYKKIPLLMGLKCSSDIAQAFMEMFLLELTSPSFSLLMWCLSHIIGVSH